MDASKLFNNLKQMRKDASAENNGGLSKEDRSRYTTYAGLHKNGKEKVGSRTTFKIVPLTFKDFNTGEDKPYSSIDGFYTLKVQTDGDGKYSFFRVPTRKAVEDYSNSINRDLLDSVDLELLDKVVNVLYDIADYYTNFQMKADVAKNASTEFQTKYKQLGAIQYIQKSLALPCFYVSKSYKNGSANGILNFNHFTFLFIEKSLMYEELLSAIENYCYSQNSEHPELVFSELFNGSKVFEIILDKKDSSGNEFGDKREEMFNKPDTVVGFSVSDATPDIIEMVNSEEVSNGRNIDPLNDYNFFGLKRIDRKLLEKIYSYALELESYLVLSGCNYSTKRLDELQVYLPQGDSITVNNNNTVIVDNQHFQSATSQSLEPQPLDSQKSDGKFENDEQPF